jgi:PAS domain S-box-containing protein
VAQDSAIDDFRLLDQLDAGIAVMNSAGVVVRWNANAERILGVPQDQAIGRPWADIAVVVSRTGTVDGEVRPAAMRSSGWHGLALLRVDSRRDVWVHAHVQPAPLADGDEQPGVIALLWPDAAPTSHDGGDPALQETVRTSGIVLAQMTEAIVTTDAAMRITSFNPAAERLYGISAAAAIGRRADELLLPLLLDGNVLDRGPLLKARSAGFWNGRVIHKVLVGPFAGRHLVVDASITSIRDGDGGVTGLLGMSKPAPADTSLESQVEALASLALAIGRSRSRREIAEAALEQLCDLTSADFGVIGTWAENCQIIEASRGFGPGTLAVIESAVIPELGKAIEQPGTIVAIETIAPFLEGSGLVEALQKDRVATGVLVDLRARDRSIGFLALASVRPGWARPADETVLQVAAQIANAVENARLTERLEEGLAQERRLTSQLETLMSLTLLPQGNLSDELVAGALLERIMGALEANIGFVVHETDNRFQVVAGRHLADSVREMVETRPADSFYFWRHLKDTQGGRAFQENLAETARSEPAVEAMISSGITGQAVFPVREGNRLSGAFLCYFTSSLEAPAVQTDDRSVEAVGRIISIAYDNARMSEGLAESAENERRLTAELRALQELTLLGASTDDITRLAQETIDEVVLATGASGGGYVLVDPSRATVDPIAFVGLISGSWSRDSEMPRVPAEWPSLTEFEAGNGIWLSATTAGAEGPGTRLDRALLPLRVDGGLDGVIYLEWSGSRRSDQYDVHFLEPIARVCSISLANFRLRSELLVRAAAQRALNHRLGTLDELTRIGEEASSFEELAHRTVSLVREALGAEGVCYLLIEPGRHFETHAVAGETGAFRLWLKGVPAKDAPGGGLLLAGGNSVLGDFVASQVSERVMPLARATGFRSFGAIPIRTGEELAGALMCFFESPAATLPLDESALDSVARIAGIALANFRLRERLVSSEERYRTLFEESPDALLVTALDGTILDVNEAAIRLYRVNRGEVLGRYFGQFVTAGEREMARRRQIVWAQGRGTFNDRGRRPDATEFPIEVEVRVVELGGQRRFLYLVRDLSDQERLSRELLQAQKMEAIGVLVSGVAHELNNPLAAIIAFSQLLRSDDRLPDDMKHDAGLLVQEADRTRRIVANLLDFARARPPERQPTSVAVLVQSVLELQSYALNTSKIQVKVEIPESLPLVDLDRAQLQQVLLNLTINAIQALRGCDRKAPGHLWVTAAMVKVRSLAGANRGEKPVDDAGRVRITIRDDGPGVPESARPRLFDPFFTTKQPGEGTGLGLSVSFGIVASHRGMLWYEPGPSGVGSSFILELPVSAQVGDGGAGDIPVPFGNQGTAASAARPTPRKSAPVSTPRRVIAPLPVGADEGESVAKPATAIALAGLPTEKPAADHAPHASGAGPSPKATPTDADKAPAGPRSRILALDDEPSIRAFLRTALMRAGMDCQTFADGAQALEGLGEANFDVMLIDHRMPMMSGTEFYEAAVAYRPDLARRAIFMSGDVLNPDLRGFATRRGIRLLSKPFDIEAVIGIVHEALEANSKSND